MEQEILAWDAPEYPWTPKTADWYWSLGIITVSVAVLCIFFGNILLALFLLIAAFSVGLYAGREPTLVHFEIQPRGIIVNNYLYTFESLESFWIEEGHRPDIILKSKKFFVPLIIVPISHIPTDEIHARLIAVLPEVEHHESIFHRVFEYFGF